MLLENNVVINLLCISVGIMKRFNFRKIRASMVVSQNLSIPPVLANLVKPKKRKRVTKMVSQSGEDIDKLQAKVAKIGVTEKTLPEIEKEKEVYEKEILEIVNIEQYTNEGGNVANVTHSHNIEELIIAYDVAVPNMVKSTTTTAFPTTLSHVQGI